MGAFCIESGQGRVVTMGTDSDMYFTRANTSSSGFSFSCTNLEIVLSELVRLHRSLSVVQIFDQEDTLLHIVS